MKYIVAFFFTLHALFALDVEEIKNIQIEDLYVYYAGGLEYVDALDEPATNAIVGATAFAPNIHELLVLEVTASYSILPAEKLATSTTKAYDAKIFNAGAYAGYFVESESPFALTPKAGLQFVYASSSGDFGLSLAAGINASYELVDQNMIVFGDFLLLSGAKILSIGLSMPLDYEF